MIGISKHGSYNFNMSDTLIDTCLIYQGALELVETNHQEWSMESGDQQALNQ